MIKLSSLKNGAGKEWTINSNDDCLEIMNTISSYKLKEYEGDWSNDNVGE